MPNKWLNKRQNTKPKTKLASVLLFVGLASGSIALVLLLKLAIHVGYVVFPPMIFVS